MTDRTLRLCGLAWLAVVILLAAWVGFRVAGGGVMDGQLKALLPATERDPVAEAGVSLAQGPLERRLVVLVGGAVGAGEAASAGREARSRLLGSGLLRPVPSPDMAAGQALAAFYLKSPWGLLPDGLRQRLGGPDPAGELERAALRRYVMPGMQPATALVERDALLLVPTYLDSLGGALGKARVALVDGDPVATRDGEAFTILQFELAGSPFSFQVQDALLPMLSAVRDSLRDRDGALRMHVAGVLPHAAAGTASARQEISTIGTASLLAVVGLLLATFRSARPLVFSLVAIGVGSLAGFATTLWLFGSVHIFTAVFAVSLVGTAEDFTFHFFATRFDRGREWCPRSAMGHVMPSITLGLLTTLVGFLGLVASGFPGLVQIAVFSMAGLCAAFLTTIWWYPLFTRRARRHDEGLLPAMADRWLAAWDRPAVRRHAPHALVVLALVSGVGAARLHGSDDVRQFQARDPAVMADEAVVRRVLGDAGSGTFLLVRGRDAAEVLRREEAAAAALARLEQAGGIAGHQAVSRFVPSPERQQADIALLRTAATGPEGALRRLAARVGLDPDLVRRQEAAVAAAVPLTVADWLADESSLPYRHLWLGRVSERDGGWHASVMPLLGVRDPAALARLDLPAGVDLVDPAAEASDMFARYRAQAAWLILGSYAGVALLLLWRYGLRGGAQVMLVPAMAAAACLGVFGFLGVGFSLFHAMALLLVLGMGVDYGLFFQESDGADRGTLIAIATSVLSTLLSFGLLGLSATAAISAFGQTVALGIILSFLASPLARRTAFQRVATSEKSHVH